MDGTGKATRSSTTEQLEALYSDPPYGPAVFKEIDRVTPQYRKLIEAAPFVRAGDLRSRGPRLLAARRPARIRARYRRAHAR